MHSQEGVPKSARSLMGRRLIVVSNREPYAHRWQKGGLKIDRPAGGLVAALDPVLQATSGTWIAWGDGEADFSVADGGGHIPVPPDSPRYTLKRIALTRPEVDDYYYGYANQVLWPLCHTIMEHLQFRTEFWTRYQDVNRRFAEAVQEEASREALVWIHDYHLALCPLYLRWARPDLFLMHFWHIPWPAWDVFRICPHRTELLVGLLANDLLVFQQARDVEHFLECAERDCGARVGDGVVEHQGRTVTVKAFPISIDVRGLERTARSPACERWMAWLRRRLRLADRSLVVSVDRLDYTKGILERLRAIDLLFQRRPEFRSRVVFFQKSAPSRTRIEAYRNLQARIDDMIQGLNTEYGTDEWQPVVHLPRPLPRAGMAALYRMADVCVVSALKDGMNLVAKEFVACQVDHRGTLLLSELAGAHQELKWAVPINPYDVEGCADALARALETPAGERKERMHHLRTYLTAHDVSHWMEQHFATANRLLAAGSAGMAFETSEALATAATAGTPLALLMDFDGTLAQFADDPDRVDLPAQIEAALERIARHPETLVAVISGRALSDIQRRVGIDGIVYAGNHGFEVEGPGWAWKFPLAEHTRKAIAVACGRLRRRLHDVPGAWVEDKGLTASIHYRRTPPRYVARVRDAVLEAMTRAPAGAIVVRQGEQVLELRPDVPWDKGSAVRGILKRAFGNGRSAAAHVVYLGDDRTDEDAFMSLPDHAVTIKVGSGPTKARYCLRTVDDVHRFIHLVDARLAALPRRAITVHGSPAEALSAMGSGDGGCP